MNTLQMCMLYEKCQMLKDEIEQRFKTCFCKSRLQKSFI